MGTYPDNLKDFKRLGGTAAQGNGLMPNCRYHQVCCLDEDIGLEGGLCILHSKDPEKDKQGFAGALKAHIEKNGGDFTRITFPDRADFQDVTFGKGANFSAATFTDEANFNGATFHGKNEFSGATFRKKANFIGAKFKEEAWFVQATFAEEANFIWAEFVKGAHFFGTRFGKDATFNVVTFGEGTDFTWAQFTQNAVFTGAKFLRGANFQDTSFEGEVADFGFSSFQGRCLFSGKREIGRTIPIFSGCVVGFNQVVIDPLDAIGFRGADLRECRFVDTDVRKIEMTDVVWAQIGGRFGVYDEIAPLGEDEVRPWGRIERVYRELKQNFEDRRDYERAGDFHYGEKEMRRRNPTTSVGLRIFLTLYWVMSGYGERYLRPLIWGSVLLLASTIGYLALGLSPKDGGSTLTLTNVWDWLRAAHYSFRVMTLLRPTDLVLLGYAKLVNTIQTILGPLFLALFALAVRQRLKR